MAISHNPSATPFPRGLGQVDGALLAKIGLGDQQAMVLLFDRHSNLVYSVALRVCRDPALAEEVLQDTFMQIWEAPQKFASEPGSLDGRLGVISRNLALDLVRQRKSIASGLKASLRNTPDPKIHTDVDERTQNPRVLESLLTDDDCRVLEMAFFEGKNTVQIAEQTGLPIDTIANKLCNALSVLRSGVPAAPAVANDALMNDTLMEDTGLEVLDLDTHPEFTSRSLHPRDVGMELEGLRRLTHSFVQNPDTILQELVNAAVDLCGADSAGISLETEEKSDDKFYHWVATAGQYNGFLNAILPRYPSACGICLERGKPQLFRVAQRFFDIMGISAPLVTDGILLPWQVEDTRGTIFIMAHGRTAAFDKNDGQIMRLLADFAALAIRHQRQQQEILQQAKSAAAAAMASRLAHEINNPLQIMMNVAFLAAGGNSGHDAQSLGQEFSVDLRRLSAVVAESLIQPSRSTRPN